MCPQPSNQPEVPALEPILLCQLGHRQAHCMCNPKEVRIRKNTSRNNPKLTTISDTTRMDERENEND